jgi:uncharacterized membrane protein YeaQ/YmgE (transglycosylase-associated protein family)
MIATPVPFHHVEPLIGAAVEIIGASLFLSGGKHHDGALRFGVGDRESEARPKTHPLALHRGLTQWQAVTFAQLKRNKYVPPLFPRRIWRRSSMLAPESILAWIVIGAIAGWLAGVIVKGYGFGVIGNIVIGIVGAGIAGILAQSMGLYTASTGGNIVAATIGALILLVVIGLLRRAWRSYLHKVMAASGSAVGQAQSVDLAPRDQTLRCHEVSSWALGRSNP